MKQASLISSKRFNEIIDSFSSILPIAVVGDVGVDKYTLGSVERISPEAPVPVLLVEKEWEQLGLAANISNNLVQLEVKSTLFSVVGDDLGAAHLENLIESKNLKTWGIIRESGRRTTFKERVTTSTQQICRVDYEQVKSISSDSKKKFINTLKDLLPGHSSLILEDYSKGLLESSLVKEIVGLAAEKKIFVSVDPGKKTDPNIFHGVDLLKPNLLEAKMMVESFGKFGVESVDELGEIILEKLKVKYLIITLGPKGMAIFDSVSGERAIIPTVAPEVYDVSGAGDTAISVITASLMTGASLMESAWMANCAAGVVVGKMGTATVSKSELQNFYKNLSTVLE